MACCNSYTECNELVTIGYLKDFIGTLIQNSNGTPVTISTSSADTYCPTYDEIKALLPIHKKGTNGPLDDVDGIVLDGTGNSTVKQQELSIEYTRWKSFTISANPTTISQCGGSTSFSYVNTLTRYKKSMGSSCSVSTTNEDKTDTQNSRVTFTTSSFGTISSHSMTVGENPHGTTGTAPARSTIVTGHVTFRGSEKTNTVTITQRALSGTYKYWYVDHGSAYGYTLTCTSTVPYTGGTATATGGYSVQYWDVYKWWDDCNHDFPNKTDNRNYRVSSFTESAGSHTFSGLPCDGKGGSYTFTYHGNSCTTTQADNPNPCQDCPPKNYTSYTDVYVTCNRGSATVNGVYHHFSGGELDDQGNCNGYTEETGNTSYTKTWDCTFTGETIDEHIHVVDAPCCSAYCEYTFADVEIPCDEAEAKTMDVAYTGVCHLSDGTTETTTGTYLTSIPKVTCNSGSDRLVQGRTIGKTLPTSKPAVTQKGGCTCPCLNPSTTVTFADVELECTSAASKTMAVAYTSVTTYSNCADEIVTGTSNVTISAVTCNSGSTRTIQEGNTGSTVSAASPKITQKGGCPCTCLNPSTTYTIADIEVECTSAASTSKSVTYTAVTTYSNCEPKTETGTTTASISAVTCNSGSTRIIQAGNTGSTLSAAKPKITQKGGCPCCECKITASPGATISKDGGSNLTIGSYSATSCVTNIGATSNQAWVTNLSASGGQVKATIASNSSTNTRTANITVTGKSGSDTCSSGFTITQEANVCVTGTTYYLSNVTTTIDCIGSDHFKGDLYEKKTLIIDGVCSTGSTLIANKNIWINPVPCNVSGSDIRTTYYVYYYASNSRVCGFTSTQSSGVYIDSYTITQPSCAGCTRGSDSMSVPVEWQAGRTCGDGSRCGFDLSGCSVTGGADWVSLTSQTSNNLSFKTLSANYEGQPRTAVFTITPTGATQTPDCCYASFCDSWTLSIVQDAHEGGGCGCSNVDVTNGSVQLQGTSGSRGTGTFVVRGACVLDLDASWGNWATSVTDKGHGSRPSWLNIEFADWTSTDGTFYFVTTEDNNTSSSRTAYYYLNTIVMGDTNDCSHWIEITQLPKT